MFCSKCGKEIGAEATFCPHCGEPVRVAAPRNCPHCGHANPAAATVCTACGQPLASAPEPRPARAYAGFWVRLAAYFLDSIIVSLGMVILGAPIVLLLGFPAIREGTHPAGLQPFIVLSVLLATVVMTALVWLYFTLAESSGWQATLGKKMLNLAVTDLAGARIGFGRANARYWSKILSGILYIGFIMIAFTDKKQGLHDLIAGTLVVRR